MAITRAQQYRQMLKQGSEPVEQAGVLNYMPSEMVTVPKKAKSSEDHPATELAYITKAEKDLLVKKDLHNSLKDGPNKGPGGVMSLNGDYSDMQAGITGEQISAAERGETPAGMSPDRARDLRAGAIAAGAGIKSGDDLATIQEANRIAKASRERFEKQKGLTFRERLNLFNINKKQKFIDRLIDQRRKKISAGLMDDSIPGVDTMTTEEMIDLAPSIADMTDKFSKETIDSVLAGDRQIDFFTPTGSPTLDAVGNIFSGPVTKEKLESLNKEIDILESINPKDTSTKELMKEFAPNQYRTVYPEEFAKGDGPEQPIIPIASQVSAPVEEEDYYADVGGNPFINRDAYRFFNKGGIADTVVGGEFDFESARQMYGLGKLVKKVGRTVKKIAKSPIGKAAILGAVGFGIPGTSFGGLLGRASFGGAAKGLFGTYGPVSALKKIGLMKTQVGPNLFERVGPLSKLGPMSGIFAASALAGLLTPKPEDDEDDEDTYRGEGLDFSQLRPYGIQRFAEGGDAKEPVAKKTMPLLDMGGKEMDLRAEGGFVPIGRMEKADDVPARLSKNEFVFTADAVRNAGDGDVDKGAEVMYNMMKNLESGGDVSEESQGLEGARKMFQTSQRLEEVL